MIVISAVVILSRLEGHSNLSSYTIDAMLCQPSGCKAMLNYSD